MNMRLKALPKLLLAWILVSIMPGILAAQEYTEKGADNCLKCHKSAKWDVMPIFNTPHGPSNEHFKAKKKSEVPVKCTFGKGDQASFPNRTNPA